MYEVGSFVTVYSGRSLPTGKVSALRRNEGVGIVMNSVVAAAWRDSEKCCFIFK